MTQGPCSSKVYEFFESLDCFSLLSDAGLAIPPTTHDPAKRPSRTHKPFFSSPSKRLEYSFCCPDGVDSVSGKDANRAASASWPAFRKEKEVGRPRSLETSCQNLGLEGEEEEDSVLLWLSDSLCSLAWYRLCDGPPALCVDSPAMVMIFGPAGNSSASALAAASAALTFEDSQKSGAKGWTERKNVMRIRVKEAKCRWNG